MNKNEASKFNLIKIKTKKIHLYEKIVMGRGKFHISLMNTYYMHLRANIYFTTWNKDRNGDHTSLLKFALQPPQTTQHLFYLCSFIIFLDFILL